MKESSAFSSSWAVAIHPRATLPVERLPGGEAAVEGSDRRWCSVQSFVLVEWQTPLSYLSFTFASNKQTPHQLATLIAVLQ